VGSGERVEVDRGDILEELVLVEDTDKVPTDESSETVSSNGEFLHDLSALLEFLYLLEDLTEDATGLSDRIARMKSTNSGFGDGPLQQLVPHHGQRHRTCSHPHSCLRRESGIRQGG